MSDERDDAVAAVLDDLVGIVERVEDLDIRPLEGRPAAEIWSALEPSVKGSLEEALSALRRVLDLYDGASAPPPPLVPKDDWNRGFDLGIDTLVHQQPSAGRVADLAFMATIELKQRRASLDRLEPTGDGWRVMSALDSARRRVRKSLTAVTAMLCAFEHIEPPLGFASELERSLEVRRVYARLRASIGERVEPRDEELKSRLRGVGTQVAMLVGRTIYPELRVDDRYQLRTLQHRILEWLRGHDESGESSIQGRRLWQDVAGFARVLGQVSQRQELLEHDARVLAIAKGTLFGKSPRAEVPQGLLNRLEALTGLDEELDALLAKKSVVAEEWRGPITRLARRFANDGGADGNQIGPATIPWGETR